MTATIPYEKDLVYKTLEAGPLNPGDIWKLIEAVPSHLTSTTFFNMVFLASQGAIPESSADLRIDREKEMLYLEQINYPSGGDGDKSKFKGALTGGKLERLSLRYPGFPGTQEDFLHGGHGFEILRNNLADLREASYDLIISSFGIAHYLVEVSPRYPGFFQRDYKGKVSVRAEELIKGKPERKLVLKFTSDLSESPEAKAYSEVIGLINSRRTK